MSLSRFAAWGAMGGLLFSGIFVIAAAAIAEGAACLQNLVFLGPLFAGIGASIATGTLALARRAQNRELFEAGSEVAEVGLSATEKKELL